MTKAVLRLLILMLIVYGSSMLWSVGRDLSQVGRELEQQRETARLLRAENTQLALRARETDEKEKWERIARQQLGLVSPEEFVIHNLGD